MSPNLDGAQAPLTPASPFRGAPVRDELWRAVQDETAERYELLEELGRGGDESVAYLARERADDRSERLVVLTLERDGGDGADFALSVLHTLGPSVPATTAGTCQSCGAPLTDWRRACPQCASDVSGVAEASGPGTSRAELRSAVARETQGKYDILGAMERAEGGGLVYFAREQATGKLAALRYFGPGAHVGGEAATPPPAPVPESTTSAPAVGAKICPQCETQYEASVQFCPRDGSALRPLRTDADLIGQIIADKYRVLEKLGEGGMGQVFLAEHVKMGARRAVKVMNRASVHDVDAVARFQRGAASAARINHTNVAAVYDYGETHDGLVYLVMEFAQGVPLTKLVEQEGRFLPPRTAAIVRQVADAITAAHDLEIVHRDLKPDNIMVGRNRDGSDCVKVVDFGIARAINSRSQVVTQLGQIVGTPEYMSPEQLGPKPLDGRSDIYSLGLVAFFMLTGTTPFSGETWQEVMVARLSQEPRKLADVRRDVEWPPALQATLDRALTRDREQRYQTAGELARDLADAAKVWRPSREQQIAERRQQRERRWRALREAVPKPVLVAGAALLVLAAAATGAAAILQRTVAAVDVVPASLTLASGGTAPLAATVRAANGRALDGQAIVWRSRNPGVATVSERGVVTGVFPGSAVIAAEGGRKRGETRVTVTAASLSVAPARVPRLRISQRLELSATARDAGGNVLRGVPVNWSTSDRAIVALGAASGAATTVTGGRAGSATISAEGGGRSGTAIVTVVAGETSGTTPHASNCDARALLNELQSLTDPRRNTVESAQRALRGWSGRLACMTARADSAEALYYFGLAYLRIERPREACRVLAMGRVKARGTAYARAIGTLLQDPELGCSQSRPREPSY